MGALAAYLFFTRSGQRLRRQLEPALEDFARDLDHLRGSVNKAAGAASEGWRWLNDALGDTERRPQYPSQHQTSPF
jgi:hypothetical protein